MTRTANTLEPLAAGVARAVPYLPLGILAGIGAVLAHLWKSACRYGGVWNGGVGQYTHFCYSDIYPLWWTEHLNEGKVPYVDYPVEYPVGIGGIMELVRRLAGLTGDQGITLLDVSLVVVAAIAVLGALFLRLTRDDPLFRYFVAPVVLVCAVLEIARRIAGLGSESGLVFYDITVFLMGLCLVGGVLLMAALAGPTRPWDAAWYAIGPAVILGAYINWDLAAGALALGGLLAWARQRQYLAGVLLALAVATKFYPLMFFGVLFLLTLRTGKWIPFAKTAVAAVGAWLLVNVPVMLINFEGWQRFYAFSNERGADWGGLWYFFQNKGWGFLADGLALNKMAVVALAALLLAISVLAVAAPRRPRLMQLCFLALAAFMITNKVWSPQYVLWLVPFAVLARPRWGALVAWQIAEVWYFFAIWLYLLGIQPEHVNEGIGDGAYFLAIWARAITIVILMALVVRDILRPEHDIVRLPGIDDQAGGVFDQAEDRFTLRPRAVRQS